MESSTIAQTIIDAINSIFETLFSSIDNHLYSVLDDMTFINSDLLSDNKFESILGTSANHGVLLIANSLLLGFLLYFSIKYLLSHLTFSPSERPFPFLIKLLLCGLFMNFSYFFLSYILDLNSYLSLAIRNLGESLFNKQICFSELISTINTTVSIGDNNLNLFSLDGLLKGTLTVSLLNLVFSYSLRYMMVKVFVLLAPFAILSASTTHSSFFFKAWIRHLFSLLFIQIIVSFVLVILFSMDYSSSDLFTKFTYIGGIYFLLKANSFVREFLGGVSTTVSQTVNNLSNFKK